jgi:hypothetical protein
MIRTTMTWTTTISVRGTSTRLMINHITMQLVEKFDVATFYSDSD